MDPADEARTRAILDLQEGRGEVPLLDEAERLDLLRRARRIAIVGASPDRSRPSHSVMRYLQVQGYDCVPINPLVRDVLGVPAFPSLEEAVAATGRFDIVDVFRRPEHVPAIARSAVATGCGALWLQLGVVDWEAARLARAGGLEVVMDRCTAIEHRKLRPARRG
ncbi:MAG TPA: CoA-binding protein [Candidatus Limnocylindrales bacterium]|jgi:predicted CoA-binding protein|nr:CoA-binding protein [Candidatus Limnocylindrales bacterium]